MILRKILNTISPTACHVCGRRLAPDENILCSSCDWRLPRTPFSGNPTDSIFARLFWGRLPIEKATALMYYSPNHESSALIRNLKYCHYPSIGVLLGRMIARENKGGGFFDDVDIVIPIPLTPQRKKLRGYNQSEEIVQGILQETGLPASFNAIERVKFNASQTSLTPIQRAENVEEAFRLVQPETVAGKHVLLVDDIVTTGATMTSCGKELMKAGNVKFSIAAIGFTQS